MHNEKPSGTSVKCSYEIVKYYIGMEVPKVQVFKQQAVDDGMQK